MKTVHLRSVFLAPHRRVGHVVSLTRSPPTHSQVSRSTGPRIPPGRRRLRLFENVTEYKDVLTLCKASAAAGASWAEQRRLTHRLGPDLAIDLRSVRRH